MASAGVLAPYMMGPAMNPEATRNPGEQQMMRTGLQLMQYVYLNHGRELLEAYPSLVAQRLQYRPGAFRGMSRFEREIFHIADDSIDVSADEAGDFKLNALGSYLSMAVDVHRSKWLVNSLDGGVSAGLVGIYCTGNPFRVDDFITPLPGVGDCVANAGLNDSISSRLAAWCGTLPEAKRVDAGDAQPSSILHMLCLIISNPEMAGSPGIPTGFHRSARGWTATRAYPGSPIQMVPNPNRGCIT